MFKHWYSIKLGYLFGIENRAEDSKFIYFKFVQIHVSF